MRSVCKKKKERKKNEKKKEKEEVKTARNLVTFQFLDDEARETHRQTNATVPYLYRAANVNPRHETNAALNRATRRTLWDRGARDAHRVSRTFDLVAIS